MSKIFIGAQCPVCGPEWHITAIAHESDQVICTDGSGIGKQHHTEDVLVARAARDRARGRPDPRFPHRCPRCGGEAYIGLSSVEHRYPRGCT